MAQRAVSRRLGIYFSINLNFFFSPYLIRVPNRVIRLDKYRIMAMVYAKHTNSAYILSDTMTESLLHGPDMLDNRGHNLFHEIKYTIGKFKKK